MRKDESNGVCQVVPIEETGHSFKALLCSLVKLVNSEWDAARSDSAAADGEKAETKEQNPELKFARTVAFFWMGDIARRWVELR